MTKPGIIFGNVITVLGGFFLGLQGPFDFFLLLYTLLGIALVIASGCVFNNFIDRDIDKLMERTKYRVSARGLMSGMAMLLYASLLGVAGTLVLGFFANLLAMYVAWLGLFFYVVVYSLWFKRHSVHGTLLGSIAGAVPPVVGYCASTPRIDLGALLLFLLLCFWQMPHSYAIAIYRMTDYTAANIPVLPLVRGIPEAKKQMLLYTIAFFLVSLMPTLTGYTGWFYFTVAFITGIIWLRYSIQGFRAENDVHWAKKFFLFSIVNITSLSVMMVLDSTFI